MAAKYLAIAILWIAVMLAPAPAQQAAPAASDLRVPRYAHIFLIIDENKSYERIMNGRDAPAIAALAKQYGNATHFYAETHPSEPNYVAIVGGSTYGIADDAAFYAPGHTTDAPSLATQIEASKLTWKGITNRCLRRDRSPCGRACTPQSIPGFSTFDLCSRILDAASTSSISSSCNQIFETASFRTLR